MNSKIETRIYLIIIVLLALIIVLLKPGALTMVFALLVIGAACFFAKKYSASKELFFSSYMDNIVRNIERANYFAISSMDVGMAVFSQNGKLQWKNDTFAQWVGKSKLEGMTPEEILPLPENLTFEMLCVKNDELPLQMNGRFYALHCRKIETQGKMEEKGNEAPVSGLMVYLKDVTELKTLQAKYQQEHLCLGYVRMDSYEDVMRGLSETEIASLSGEINTQLTKWVAEHAGFICRMNKEMSLVGFTRAALEEIETSEFDVLKKIRAIRLGNKFPPTLSMGFDCDGENLEDMMRNANDMLSQALYRGGDQAIVSKNGTTKAYGATSIVNAKSTRVRVRMVANAIKEDMQKAERIFIMGHYGEDFDALGAAIGVAKMAKSLNKETVIVTSGANNQDTSLNKIVAMLDSFWSKAKAQGAEGEAQESMVHYPELLVQEDEALKLVTPASLLIIVDHHRASLSASRKLLEAIPKRIIIDHHRRAEDIMADDNTLLYLEPSSSSSCELVTELTGYFDGELRFSSAEATALYTGIVLDTKNFVNQTSERTFEAAALLRRSGAEPNLVKDLFKDDFLAIQQRSKLIATARMPVEGLAICVNSNVEKSEAATVLAAQTSDRLIAVVGVLVSVTMNEYTDGSLSISARSTGSVNVQIIMEALGGGGHQTVAGAQLADKRAQDVEPVIIEMARKQLVKINEEKGETEA